MYVKRTTSLELKKKFVCLQGKTCTFNNTRPEPQVWRVQHMTSFPPRVKLRLFITEQKVDFFNKNNLPKLMIFPYAFQNMAILMIRVYFYRSISYKRFYKGWPELEPGPNYDSIQ